MSWVGVSFEQAKEDHLVRVRVEEELRSARADDAWYEEHPERKTVWPDLYGEHVAKLKLLERLTEGDSR